MPDTSMGITYPASTAHTRLWEHFQELASDLNGLLDLPDPVTGTSNTLNTITATTWADLPTTCAASLTNPHASRPLLCLVTWSAWMTASANAVRACPRVSGSLTIAAGAGGLATSWGQIPRANTEYTQFSGQSYVELPVSGTAATFTLQAYREAATGTQQVNYAVLQVVPLRFVS